MPFSLVPGPHPSTGTLIQELEAAGVHIPGVSGASVRRPCRTCGRPVERPGPAYCSPPCWDKAAARRRRVAAGRARARRRAISTAANTTIDTEGAWIITRVWVNGHVQSETREPVA